MLHVIQLLHINYYNYYYININFSFNTQFILHIHFKCAIIHIFFLKKYTNIKKTIAIILYMVNY